MNDKDFLNWIADRFVHVIGESSSVDFVVRLREIAERVTPDMGAAWELLDELHECRADHTSVTIRHLYPDHAAAIVNRALGVGDTG